PVFVQADVYEQEQKTHAAYQQFLQSQIILLPSEFKGIPSTVRRIAVVDKTAHKRLKKGNKLPRRTKSMIASRINSRLIPMDRFDLVQCLDCGAKKITIRDNKLDFDNVLQNNESLRRKGRDLNLDAFLTWDAFIDGDEVILKVQMVQTLDNQIIWEKKYSGPYDPTAYQQFNLDVNVGLYGFDLERKYGKPNTKPEKVDNIAHAGVRLRERFSAADRVEFSIGVEWFGPIANRDKFKFNGFAGEGRIVIDILPLMKNLKTNLYIAAGAAYYKKQTSMLFKYGIEIPFQRFGYISFGGIYLPKKTLEFDAVDDLSKEAEFGGTSYNVTLGIRL
ncbi:MAG: hypothetical protein HRT87_00890, partial [Legionellales bacterium]|nr:hypothetical protein [Legionellales bacterium]